MLNHLGRHRRGLVAAVALAGAVLASMGLAVPAGATPVPSQNTLMIGSGSSTTYYMMQGMDTLFNGSNGCAAFDPTGQNQHLDFTCLSDPSKLTPGSGENPYNDLSTQETPLGSSTGIQQLENQGSLNSTYTCKNGVACPSSQVDYARSSRALKSSDLHGLNFVAYAKDGVDWVHFDNVPGIGAGPSSSVTNLDDAQIAGIWNGTVNNWYQITHNPADNAPICVYTAQDGSGTLATWDGYTGVTTETQIGTLTPNTSALKNGPKGATKFVNAGCYDGSNASKYGATHQIFENETKMLIANGKAQTGPAKYADTADSIFFYSFGRYEQQCLKGLAICEPKGFTVRDGTIDGIAATHATIIGKDAPGYNGPLFPVPRYLYNVYSNGSNSAMPRSSAAVINYVSEVGFGCKPQTFTEQVVVSGKTEIKTAPIIDPNTGVSYRSEINKIIQSFGFLVLPIQKNENQGTISEPAVTLLPSTGTGSAYSYFDPRSTTVAGQSSAQQARNLAAKAPSGYCKVFTTG